MTKKECFIVPKVNGVRVNVEYYLSVDMMSEVLNNFQNHPAFNKERTVRK